MVLYNFMKDALKHRKEAVTTFRNPNEKLRDFVNAFGGRKNIKFVELNEDKVIVSLRKSFLINSEMLSELKIEASSLQSDANVNTVELERFDGDKKLIDEVQALPNVEHVHELVWAGSSILKALGGWNNIGSFSYCATRLRLFLKNVNLVEESVLYEWNASKIVFFEGQSVHVVLGLLSEEIGLYIYMSAAYEFNLLAIAYVKALGGIDNLAVIDNCMTRLRIELKNGREIDEDLLVKLGSAKIITKANRVQIAAGECTELLADRMRKVKEEDLELLDNWHPNERVGLNRTVIVKPQVDLSHNRDIQNIDILAPISGEIIPIEDVPDDIFKEKIMGDGIAVIPKDNVLVSPFSGKVISIAKTNHAIVVEHKSGVAALMHIGIDTVHLRGRGFRRLIDEGSFVEVGTPIMAFDVDIIEKENKSPISPLIITQTNSMDLMKFIIKDAKKGESVVLKLES